MSSPLPLNHDPLRPPQDPALGRGFALAVLAHALLVAGLTLGVQWHSQTEPAFEAELWTLVPQAAAPAANEPEPPPPPPTEPVPAKTEAAPPPPPAAAVQQQQRDAEIAIAKDRERKQREKEAKEAEDAKREALRKKEQADKERQEKDRLEKEKQDKLDKERQRKEDLAKEQAKKDQQAKLDKQREDKERQDKEKADKAAQAKLDALRKQNLERMMGMAGATGAPGSTGNAKQSSGPSATYAGRIKARIRPNIIYTEQASGNPVAEVEVKCAPDGTIVGRKLLKPSGDADWDRAVLRAIDRTETLPRDVDGRVPPVLVISFKPGE